MKYLILILILFTSLKLNAQTGIVVCGNSITNASGSISSSVGQIDYKSVKNSSHSISEGLQQSVLEIIDLTSIKDITSNLIDIFPNPTSDKISIKVVNAADSYKYNLISNEGKCIETGKLNNTEITSISFDKLPQGQYQLIITSNTNSINTFKIIKN